VLIWSALPEKLIGNSVKDFRKRLEVCLSASSGYFGHINIQILTDIFN